jgi:hypothetical protein
VVERPLPREPVSAGEVPPRRVVLQFQRSRTPLPDPGEADPVGDRVKVALDDVVWTKRLPGSLAEDKAVIT